MADGTDTGATTTTTDAGDGAGGNGGDGASKTFTQEQVNDLIAREKGKIQSRFADYDDLKSAAQRLAEIEDANKTELEKATGERDTFKGRAETAESRLARYEAAAKAGLDIKHAGRIQGATPDEMEADAKALAEEFGATGGGGGDYDGGARSSGDVVDMNTQIRRAAGRT